jgi:hypothetical protein
MCSDKSTASGGCGNFHTLDAPGLKVRRNKAGAARLLWVARADVVRAGYTPKCVRLHYRLDDPVDRLLISSACTYPCHGFCPCYWIGS